MIIGTMKIFPKSIDIGEYLRSSAVIDYMNESVSGLADTLFEKSGNNNQKIDTVIEFPVLAVLIAWVASRI